MMNNNSEFTLDDLKLISIPKDFVPIDYLMDPNTDDILRGYELEEGMIVLIEDIILKEDPEGFEDKHPLQKNAVLKNSRWCMVQRPTIDRDILSFVGLYGDGTKMSRNFNVNWYWLVKKNSI